MKKLSICVMSTLATEKYKNQILGCHETWEKDAQEKDLPVHYFCGDIRDENFPFVTHLDGVGDDYYSATLKQYQGLKYLYHNHPSEFYLIIGTDTYVNIDRMLKMLSKYDYKHEFIIGGYGQTRNIMGYSIFFSLGGAGIVLSHSALEKLYPFFDDLILEWEKETSQPSLQYLRGGCDVSLYHLAWREGVTQVIERDLYACSWSGNFYNNYNIISHNFCGKININKMITCHFMEKEDMILYKRWGDKGDLYHQLKQKDMNETLYRYAKGSNKILVCHNPSSLHSFLLGLIDNLQGGKITAIVNKKEENEYVNLGKKFEIDLQIILFEDFQKEDYDLIFIDPINLKRELEFYKQFLISDGILIVKQTRNYVIDDFLEKYNFSLEEVGDLIIFKSVRRNDHC